jgi:CRP/FNR family cyclic AMP-dependent transcriptional regulator
MRRLQCTPARFDASFIPMSQATGPFAQLDDKALLALAPHGLARTFRKNAVVVNEGDQTDSLYVVLTGRVKVFVTGDDGREVVVSTIEPGDYFGEVVLDGGPRSASVMTLEPSRLFVIPHGDVEGLLTASPAFARSLIGKLTGKIRGLTGKVRDLALKDVYGRFVRFVEENAVERDGERRIAERLTQGDIAARIGGSREMVSRIVRDLSAGGYIAVDAKHIRILKKLPPNW